MQILTTARSRYREGQSRQEVFRDLIRESISGPHTTVLDIGCGEGLDGDRPLQASIAEAAGCLVGVEPDEAVAVPDFFAEVHRSFFEDASIEPDSIDVAYSAFVLEHIATPDRFWQKLHDVLRPGGVFWGLTMDARHFFAAASSAMERLRVKDLYLTKLRGRRGEERYANYPTCYRANTPRQIRRSAGMFRQLEFASMHRVGALDYYVPRRARPVAHLMDRVLMGVGYPGSLLLVRAEK